MQPLVISELLIIRGFYFENLSEVTVCKLQKEDTF